MPSQAPSEPSSPPKRSPAVTASRLSVSTEDRTSSRQERSRGRPRAASDAAPQTSRLRAVGTPGTQSESGPHTQTHHTETATARAGRRRSSGDLSLRARVEALDAAVAASSATTSTSALLPTPIVAPPSLTPTASALSAGRDFSVSPQRRSLNDGTRLAPLSPGFGPSPLGGADSEVRKAWSLESPTLGPQFPPTSSPRSALAPRSPQAVRPPDHPPTSYTGGRSVSPGLGVHSPLGFAVPPRLSGLGGRSPSASGRAGEFALRSPEHHPTSPGPAGSAGADGRVSPPGSVSPAAVALQPISPGLAPALRSGRGAASTESPRAAGSANASFDALPDTVPTDSFAPSPFESVASPGRVPTVRPPPVPPPDAAAPRSPQLPPRRAESGSGSYVTPPRVDSGRDAAYRRPSGSIFQNSASGRSSFMASDLVPRTDAEGGELRPSPPTGNRDAAPRREMSPQARRVMDDMPPPAASTSQDATASPPDISMTPPAVVRNLPPRVPPGGRRPESTQQDGEALIRFVPPSPAPAVLEDAHDHRLSSNDAIQTLMPTFAPAALEPVVAAAPPQVLSGSEDVFMARSRRTRGDNLELSHLSASNMMRSSAHDRVTSVRLSPGLGSSVRPPPMREDWGISFADDADNSDSDADAASASPQRAKRTQDKFKPIDRVGPFEVYSELGRGRTARVLSAVDEEDGTLAAVKVQPRRRVQYTRDGNYPREAWVLAQLAGHPHVVQLLGCVDGMEYVALVLEHVEGKALTEVDEATGRCAAVGPGVLRRYVADVLSVLVEMERRHIVHADLKFDNVLVTGAGVVKMIDFGAAHLYHERSQLPVNVAAHDDGVSSTSGCTPQPVHPENLIASVTNDDIDPVQLAEQLNLLGESARLLHQATSLSFAAAMRSSSLAPAGDSESGAASASSPFGSNPSFARQHNIRTVQSVVFEPTSRQATDVPAGSTSAESSFMQADSLGTTPRSHRVVPARRLAQDAQAGAPLFSAPEVLAGAAPSTASDLFALGIMVFTAATGRTPVEVSDTVEAHKSEITRTVRKLYGSAAAAAFNDVQDIDDVFDSLVAGDSEPGGPNRSTGGAESAHDGAASADDGGASSRTDSPGGSRTRSPSPAEEEEGDTSAHIRKLLIERGLDTSKWDLDGADAWLVQLLESLLHAEPFYRETPSGLLDIVSPEGD